jgi:hypothetical protein
MLFADDNKIKYRVNITSRGRVKEAPYEFTYHSIFKENTGQRFFPIESEKERRKWVAIRTCRMAGGHVLGERDVSFTGNPTSSMAAWPLSPHRRTASLASSAI